VSIKHYQLAKDEGLPDEFCVVRDIGGEPGEYTFYVPESENTKLRQQLDDVTESMGRVEEQCARLQRLVDYMEPIAWYAASPEERRRMREMGVDR